jgi:hypothetical protein
MARPKPLPRPVPPEPADHASESAQITLIGAPQSATPGGRDSRQNGYGASHHHASITVRDYLSLRLCPSANRPESSVPRTAADPDGLEAVVLSMKECLETNRAELRRQSHRLMREVVPYA